MNYQIHNKIEELDAPEWNRLLREAITDAPFLRYEYQRAWLSHWGGGEWRGAQLTLIAAREEGRLIGVAPLFIAEYEGAPKLLLVGSVEISDYLDLIVRPQDHARFVSGLLEFIAARKLPPLDWYNLPNGSPTLPALREEAARRGWTFAEETYRPTPRIELRGDFEEYLSRVEKKQRHEIRRKLRRFEESGRGGRWRLADMRDPQAEIAAFLRLMEQDENKARFLTEAMRAQISDIIRAAHENGWLWLAFLEADGKPIAACLNFDYGGKLWGYNAGVDRAYMEFSPGWTLLTYTLRWACENRRAEFDFMRGDEEYKYRFGALNRYVMRARVEF